MLDGSAVQKLDFISFSQKELNKLFINSREGDLKAFSKLSRYVRQISYSYFLSKYRSGKIYNKDDVDDLTNNVYLSFAEQYHKIDNLEFWIRRVLFLNFVNWYKKNKARRTINIDEVYYLKEKESNPGDIVDAGKILELLKTLSEEKQKIIKLRFYEYLKFSEIAEVLNKSEVAVKKMFYRTLEELKNKL
jgi:RNA polymerase sigma-70 factor, ECF subfamily